MDLEQGLFCSVTPNQADTLLPDLLAAKLTVSVVPLFLILLRITFKWTNAVSVINSTTSKPYVLLLNVTLFEILSNSKTLFIK